MKKTVLSFILVFVALSGKASDIVCQSERMPSVVLQNSLFQKQDRGGKVYTKDSWNVFYRGREVEGASASSFEDLGGGYGKDAWKVFHEGFEVKGVSPLHSRILAAVIPKTIGPYFTETRR